jgi:hypothetical protein
LVRVKSYEDVLEEYRRHPEVKSAGPEGLPCTEATVGLLQPRDVFVNEIVHIGKESNEWEDVALGIKHDFDEVLEMHENPTRDTWITHALPILRLIPKRQVAKLSGVAERTITRLRNQHSLPQARTKNSLLEIAVQHATDLLERTDVQPEVRQLVERFLATQMVRRLQSRAARCQRQRPTAEEKSA